MNKMTTAKPLLMIGLLILGSVAMAQQDPISLQHKAQQWERFTDESGVEQTRLVAASRVLPGEELLFTVTYTNTGNQPTRCPNTWIMCFVRQPEMMPWLLFLLTAARVSLRSRIFRSLTHKARRGRRRQRTIPISAGSSGVMLLRAPAARCSLRPSSNRTLLI